MTVYVSMEKRCPTCDGSGLRTIAGAEHDTEEPCQYCEGTGVVKSRTSRAAALRALQARSQR